MHKNDKLVNNNSSFHAIIWHQQECPRDRRNNELFDTVKMDYLLLVDRQSSRSKLIIGAVLVPERCICELARALSTIKLNRFA